MRIPLIIAIIALALNIGIDAYIARSIRRVFGKARRAVKAHIIISVVAAAALAFVPSVVYDRYARRKELLTYHILRVF